MMEAVFLKVLNMSAAASAVILLVMLARLMLRRLPKGYSYALWGVVLFRLICPVSIESALSLLPVNAEPIPQNIGMMPSPRIDLGVAPIDRSVNAVLPPPIDPTASVNPMQVWIAVGSFLWISGILLLLAGSILSLMRLRRGLRGAVWEDGNVWLVSGLESPFVMGILRPRIYLPNGLAGEEKGYILLHEQTHIRRGDHLIRLLAFLILCVHWFNPLVWLSFSLCGRDMEMSCDERVIRLLGDGVKHDYSGSLLSLATGRRLFGGTPLAFGEGDTGTRIKNVLRYQKPALWAAKAAAVLVAAVCIGLAVNPKDKGEASSPGEAIFDFVVAESPITLHDGVRASLQLVINEGRIFDGEAAGLGGGVVPGENFAGRCELRLLAGGAVRSSLALSAEEQTTDGMHFSHRGFPIRFGDYNEDGTPDFSIGQWGSSSVNLFSLFTIDGTGEIRRISDPLWIASSEGKGQEDYSVLFSAADRVIQTQYYDNAIGAARPIYFVWDEARGKFDEQDDPLAAERQFIAALLSSCSVEEGVVSLTIPPEIPDRYRIAVHVSGLMLTQDDSNLSLHAFEREESDGSWEPGRTYRERIFEGEPPDQTELSCYVGFLDGEQTVVLWDTLPFAFEDGATHVPASPLDTTVAVREDAGVTVLTYTDSVGGQFSARLTLPQGWSAAPVQPGEIQYASMLFAPVNLYAGGRCVGTIGYNEFQYNPEAQGENFRVSVYNQIMLGSVVSWDDSYTPVKTGAGAETATCRIRYQTGGAGGTTEYNDGVLSYDIGLLKYLAVELADGAADAAQLRALAESVRLSQ